MDDTLKDKKDFIKKKDSPTLKESHKYLYQVQGQRYCSNLDRLVFAVCLVVFWSSKVLPELSFFHRIAVLAEYFTRSVAEGKTLYLNGGLTDQ